MSDLPTLFPVALEEIEWPVVPLAAVSQHRRLTVAVLQYLLEKEECVEA